MKITQLDIEGFRSLRKVIWFPGDLNVIIGPNGTGKSNLLRFNYRRSQESFSSGICEKHVGDAVAVNWCDCE